VYVTRGAVNDGGILERIAGRNKEFEGNAIDFSAQEDVIGRCIAAGFKDQNIGNEG